MWLLCLCPQGTHCVMGGRKRRPPYCISRPRQQARAGGRLGPRSGLSTACRRAWNRRASATQGRGNYSVHIICLRDSLCMKYVHLQLDLCNPRGQAFFTIRESQAVFWPLASLHTYGSPPHLTSSHQKLAPHLAQTSH